jgi:seryl-tRNA synthetase
MSNQAKVNSIFIKTIEAKKDEFRNYLEKTGVIDQLTRTLVSLYEESDKPQNALEYINHKLSFIKRNLNAPDDIDTDNLKNEYLKLKDENERLRRKIDELTKEVNTI